MAVKWKLMCGNSQKIVCLIRTYLYIFVPKLKFLTSLVLLWELIIVKHKYGFQTKINMCNVSKIGMHNLCICVYIWAKSQLAWIIHVNTTGYQKWIYKNGCQMKSTCWKFSKFGENILCKYVHMCTKNCVDMIICMDMRANNRKIQIWLSNEN